MSDTTGTPHPDELDDDGQLPEVLAELDGLPSLSDMLIAERDEERAPVETAAGLARLRDRPDVFGAADDELAQPNPRIRAAVEQMRADRQATPDRDGYTFGVYLPPGISEDVRDRLGDQIMDLVADTVPDAGVVGQAGDPLGAVDGEPRP